MYSKRAFVHWYGVRAWRKASSARLVRILRHWRRTTEEVGAESADVEGEEEGEQ